MSNNNERIYERTINYYETDKMGIVHHSNYARFLEEARIYYMQQGGVPYSYFEDNGLMIPVLELKSSFKESLQFGDKIKIITRISKVETFKFYFSYEIYDENMKSLKHTALSVHCFVDNQFKPVSLKKIMPDMYESMYNLQDEENKRKK